MNITVSSTVTVFLQCMAFFFATQSVFVQWEILIQDANGNWVVNPANSNAKNTTIALGATEYAAFTAMTYAQQVAAIPPFLQAYYTAAPTLS